MTFLMLLFCGPSGCPRFLECTASGKSPLSGPEPSRSRTGCLLGVLCEQHGGEIRFRHAAPAGLLEADSGSISWEVTT